MVAQDPGAASISQLPALQVVIPLLAASLCVLVRRGALAWWCATVAVVASFGVACALLQQVADQGVIDYALGGWAPPIGIAFRVDAVGALMLLVVSGAGLLTMLWARRSVQHEVPHDAHLFYALLMLALAGLLGISITGDVFNLFVFLEISSLASYALVAFSRDRRALIAAYRYLLMGSVGATFVLIGIGFLYMMTGTLNMADLAQRLPPVDDTATVRAAFAFLTVGISLKLALFPLHLWLPDAYTYAPSAVTVFLSGTATKVAVYVLVRFFFTVFGPAVRFVDMVSADVVVPLAAIGALSTSAVAIFQHDIKRVLAYSSVAQISYMVLGIGLASRAGVAAGLLHLFNHAVMKTALFMALGGVVLRVGSAQFADVQGLARRMPWTAAAIAVCGAGLVGMPLTAGFASKWYLISAAIDQDRWLIAAMIVASSVLALIYVGRVVEAMFHPGNEHAPRREAPWSMLVPTLLLAAATVWWGVRSEWPWSLARSAAAAVVGAPG